MEGDPWVLSRLLWTWLEELACPVLSESDIEGLCDMTRDPIKAVKQLPKGTRDTLECLFTTMAELLPLPSADLEDRALRRLSMVLTQNRVLSLTNPRASFDRMASNSSEGLPESSPEGGGDKDDVQWNSDIARDFWYNDVDFWSRKQYYIWEIISRKRCILRSLTDIGGSHMGTTVLTKWGI
ncbi:predicted protein [Nematostella vectensis]|uniref:Rho-GAP domain-containing protein n=1 Tax=Nematostella vectensis TaxID=45351 RepID=A7SC90_NEMVE|nr:predicted protein [Nematostella vectensis]|eukprot:XP_001630680.1 predicted protein [Nematostella vectensis]